MRNYFTKDKKAKEIYYKYKKKFINNSYTNLCEIDKKKIYINGGSSFLYLDEELNKMINEHKLFTNTNINNYKFYDCEELSEYSSYLDFVENIYYYYFYLIYSNDKDIENIPTDINRYNIFVRSYYDSYKKRYFINDDYLENYIYSDEFKKYKSNDLDTLVSLIQLQDLFLIIIEKMHTLKNKKEFPGKENLKFLSLRNENNEFIAGIWIFYDEKKLFIGGPRKNIFDFQYEKKIALKLLFIIAKLFPNCNELYTFLPPIGGMKNTSNNEFFEESNFYKYISDEYPFTGNKIDLEKVRNYLNEKSNFNYLKNEINFDEYNIGDNFEFLQKNNSFKDLNKKIWYYYYHYIYPNNKNRSIYIKNFINTLKIYYDLSSQIAKKDWKEIFEDKKKYLNSNSNHWFFKVEDELDISMFEDLHQIKYLFNLIISNYHFNSENVYYLLDENNKFIVAIFYKEELNKIIISSIFYNLFYKDKNIKKEDIIKSLLLKLFNKKEIYSYEENIYLKKFYIEVENEYNIKQVNIL